MPRKTYVTYHVGGKDYTYPIIYVDAKCTVCGTVNEVRKNALADPYVCRPCRTRAQAKKNYRHGRGNDDPTYRTWRAMHRRCRGTAASSRHYQNRGITVCERWKLFENFLADMGDRPAGKTIDRIDNDGNYEPGNCRWATASEQAKNKRERRRNAKGQYD